MDKKRLPSLKSNSEEKQNTAAREYDVSVGQDKWIEVYASSFSFKTYVKSIKERFRLIYQAATMQIKKCVQIIGDKDGEGSDKIFSYVV